VELLDTIQGGALGLPSLCWCKKPKEGSCKKNIRRRTVVKYQDKSMAAEGPMLTNLSAHEAKLLRQVGDDTVLPAGVAACLRPRH
jgi:hypothetical protein